MEKYAREYLLLNNREIAQIIEQTSDAVADTRNDMVEYIADHPEFSDIGEKMMACWEDGMQDFS
ncbi:MAG: hypothetical protein U9R29_07490 [Thermodesulfobacteriota bacterium]|nr:hypothetical protein [Thermodesulfobacteriota bacterium]